MLNPVSTSENNHGYGESDNVLVLAVFVSCRGGSHVCVCGFCQRSGKSLFLLVTKCFRKGISTGQHSASFMSARQIWNWSPVPRITMPP